MKVFADRGQYDPAKRGYLNPILRLLWNDHGAAARKRLYGSRALVFEMVPDIRHADLVVVPMIWNYYVENDCVGLAKVAVDEAHRANRPVLIVSKGDHPANLPFSNVILLEQSAYRSRRSENGNRVFALPPFRRDYVELYCDGQVRIRDKRPVPTVGFCGQADGTPVDFLRRDLTTRFRCAAYRLGLRKWEPAPLEPTRFRNKVLTRLVETELVNTDFVLRKRYRAGYHASKKDPYHPSRLEFVENILNTGYTLCVRGAGNFSVRFYETLALGRIPVFVDTDCVLPYDDIIDYTDYVVWVDSDEIPYIDEKIAEFHDSLSREEFLELQLACRNLWVNYLSADGFYRHFPRLFEDRGQGS